MRPFNGHHRRVNGYLTTIKKRRMWECLKSKLNSSYLVALLRHLPSLLELLSKQNMLHKDYTTMVKQHRIHRMPLIGSNQQRPARWLVLLDTRIAARWIQCQLAHHPHRYKGHQSHRGRHWNLFLGRLNKTWTDCCLHNSDPWHIGQSLLAKCQKRTPQMKYLQIP